MDIDYITKTQVIVTILTTVLLGLKLLQRIQTFINRRNFKAENNCQPLFNIIPTKDPFLGTDLLLRQLKAVKELRLLDEVTSQFQKHGNTFGSLMVGRRIIMTIEPQNVKTILSLRFKDFGIADRQRYFGQLLGQGIFTTDGEQWSHSRQLVRPNFVKEQVADIGAFERHIQDMFNLLPTDGSTVDLQELFFRFTIDSATEFLFGQSVHSLRSTADGGLSKVNFADAFNCSQHDCAERFRFGIFYPLVSWKARKRAKEANAVCHAFVDQFVDQALEYKQAADLQMKTAGEKAPDRKYIFLRELACATNNKRQLRDELLNILLAGRDTTASLLSNMFFEISKRPHIWEKMRAEISHLSGELPNYEQLRNFKYIKHCINESLRLHPVVPYNYRQAVVDTILPLGGGLDGASPVFVPKGMVVHYVPYSMHRRKDFFGQDADEYRPERWETLRPGWEFLPFNGGPRICLGQQYALTEATYVTVRLLQKFVRLESRDSDPWREALTLTICSQAGVMVGLIPADK